MIRARLLALSIATFLVPCVACLDRPPGLPAPAEDPPLKPRAEESSERSPAPEGEDHGDPLSGNFTLEQATAGLSGTGALVATIVTSKGAIRCELFDDRAPISVANFVGLARGVRPFKSRAEGKWVKRPAFDGTTFHRVIQGFMIQGGDPEGSGKGDPGYVIPDEIWPGATHDRAGQLCMANRGANTNGMQFFITDAAVPRLDGKYTIFGQCEPAAVVHTIAAVPKGAADRPTEPVTIEKITIATAAR